MTVATPPSTDARAGLLLDLVKIDAYADFATGVAPLPMALIEHVEQVSGRPGDDPELIVAIQRWRMHYAQPIGLLRRFRDGLLNGTAVDEQQLVQVARTAHDILTAVDARAARLR